MDKNYNKRDKSNQYKIGRGCVNNLINRLLVELHLPGYQFCASREHDVAYSQSEDIDKRHQAFKILTEEAWQRVKSKDSALKERINAWFVTNAMKAKVKFGLDMSTSETGGKKNEEKRSKK
uniref:Uncharacterized protein n=1 Tax=Glossina morsitans morsitans TaxID=37546 RepID=A0A1B0G5I8_GLOMM